VLVVGAAFLATLAGCAKLAGISDAPSPEENASVDAEVDGGPTPEAAAPAESAAPGPDVATIDVRCNGVLVAKYACPRKRWEYDFAPCPGPTRKVELQNPGKYPVAFIARRAWVGSRYVPNEATDGTYGEIVGIIPAAGGSVDVSSAYGGGIFGVVVSVRPFDAAFETAPDPYEGRVVYAQAMLAGEPTNNELFAAELTATPFNGARCTSNPVIFTKK
jgi:hypothetical protein